MNLGPNELRRFYVKRFEKQEIHDKWPRIWNKQFKLRLYDNTFLNLNKRRQRLNHSSLRRYAIHYAPVNVNMSVLGDMCARDRDRS